jgi:uncharacterized protein YegJ (DUF2314 family)
MAILRILLLILLLPFLLLLRLLAGKREDMVHLPDDHPEMAKAIADARASLDEFRRHLAAPGPGMADFALKVKFPTGGCDGSTVEHIWVDHLEAKGAGFTGKLANDPQSIPNAKLGSPVEIEEHLISDWAYSENGVFRGHHTTRVLLPHMSKKMRQQVEQTFGWEPTEVSVTEKAK